MRGSWSGSPAIGHEVPSKPGHPEEERIGDEPFGAPGAEREVEVEDVGDDEEEREYAEDGGEQPEWPMQAG